MTLSVSPAPSVAVPVSVMLSARVVSALTVGVVGAVVSMVTLSGVLAALVLPAESTVWMAML